MPNETNSQQLLRRIKNRRRTLDAYLQVAKPRAERLTYVCVISSALAASLMAGPAIGGQRFTNRVALSLELSPPSLVWQILCSLAMVASVIAAISANLSKSKDAEARIVSAEACCAELEGLQAMVEFRQVSLEEAVTLYQQYITRVPFVPEQLPRKEQLARRKN
jgi:hypothetical protein